MGKIKSHDHYANQKGWVQPMAKPSPSSTKKVGITPTLTPPTPSTVQNIGITPPKP